MKLMEIAFLNELKTRKWPDNKDQLRPDNDKLEPVNDQLELAPDLLRKDNNQFGQTEEKLEQAKWPAQTN